MEFCRASLEDANTMELRLTALTASRYCSLRGYMQKRSTIKTQCAQVQPRADEYPRDPRHGDTNGEALQKSGYEISWLFPAPCQKRVTSDSNGDQQLFEVASVLLAKRVALISQPCWKPRSLEASKPRSDIESYSSVWCVHSIRGWEEREAQNGRRSRCKRSDPRN
jgi:hypothetical protein